MATHELRCAKADLGGFRWRLMPGVPDGMLADVLALRDGSSDAETVKQKAYRAVFKVMRAYGTIYVKWYRFRGLADSLGALFRGSRGEREWRMALRFRAAGVNVPEVLALGVRRRWGLPIEGFLAMREVPGVSLNSLLPALSEKQCGPPAARRHALARRLGETLGRIHRSGLFPPDLHAENVLVSEAGQVALIDLHAAKGLGPLPGRARLWNLACLHRIVCASGATRTDRLRFLRAYLGDEWTPQASRDWERRCAKKAAALLRRKERRSKRR